ncbi:putative ribonuclease H-like domain-containing protein [Tanacetum coccineum]
MALGYQNPFYLKQAQRKQQSLYNGKVLLEKHDPPVVHDSEETLQLAQERVFVFSKDQSQEEVYFVNTSKTATVSKSISIPNEEVLDDTTLSVARKFLNETLELEIERLLRAVVSQDIMSIVQNPSVVDSSNLQTELDRTKERLENCIIKKENEYAKLWKIGVDNTAKTRRPQPRSNTKNDRVPSVSKSSCNKNKEVKVEEHHRNLLLSKNTKHMSSEKSKRASHPPKPVPNSKQRLHLLHMDLCGPMRIASINGKRYVLVIVDDYTRYTWSPVIIIRTDNGTEFKNQILKEYFDSVGISHQASSVRTPQQNGVVERRNRTLVEAARTMLIFSRAPLFLWAEAIATSDLDLTYAPSTITTQKTSEGELDLTVRQLCMDDYIGGSNRLQLPRTTPTSFEAPQISTPTATTYNTDTTPTPRFASSQANKISNTSQDVDELQNHINSSSSTPQQLHDIVPNAMLDGNMFVNPFAPPSTSAYESSFSQYVDPLNMHTFYQPTLMNFNGLRIHPLDPMSIGRTHSTIFEQIINCDPMVGGGGPVHVPLSVKHVEPKHVKEGYARPSMDLINANKELL